MGLVYDNVVINTDALCEIDISTRKIINKTSKTQMLQYDHNSERIGFTMPRYIDNFDLSKVDRVAIKYLNVRNNDMYIVDDLAVSDDEQTITFSWLVSGNATKEVGSLAFLINFRCYDDDGTITYNWSTLPSSTYSILKCVISMDSNPTEQYDFWARYETLVNTVINNTEKVGDRLGVVSNRATVAENLVNDLEDAVDILAAKNTNLSTTVNNMSASVPALTDKVSILERDIPVLEEKVEALERTLDEDAIQVISSDLSNVKNALSTQGQITFELQHGTVYSGTVTTDEISNSRLITTEKIVCSNGLRIVNNLSSEYYFGIIYYNADGTWSNADPGWIKDREYTLGNYGYVHLNFRHKDDYDLTDDDIAMIKARFEVHRTDLEFAKNTDLIKSDRLIDTVVNHYTYNGYDILLTGTISNGQIGQGAQIRCCTRTHIRVRAGMKVRFTATDYYYGIACFDKNKVYDGVDHGWMQNDFYIDFDGYILMNFRTSTDAIITDTDVVNIKNACYIENYIKYDDWFVEDITAITADSVSRERALSSISIEYGRHEGASYVFCRIPKTLNDGRIIVPKVKLTSTDGSISGSKRSTLTYAQDTNTIFVMNAGLFNMTTSEPVGQTIIDGVSITNTPMEDDNGTTISDTECYPLCVNSDGILSAPYDRSVDTATMIVDGIVQAVTGWGKIVDNFEIALDDINAEIVHTGLYIRQSIGQYQNGDYAVCTVDMSRGSVENEAGITYEALAQIFVDHGVKFAYSLDGGGSAQTVIGKRQLNPIYEGTVGRKVPTVISFEIVD